MGWSKHPFLTVLIIIGAVGLFLSLIMAMIFGVFPPFSGLSFGKKIGVIPLKGKIENSIHILSQLEEFKKDSNIKAIIIRINSPGGRVGASQEIYREIRKITRSKIVVASMGDLAASGAYYIACAANKIVANPGTITGSIGVIVEFIQLQDLLKKIGIGLEVVKSGQFKDMGSPHRQLTQKEKMLIQGVIFDIKNQFVKAVAKSRHIPVEKVEAIADGRIFSGREAKELGLIDMLGNFRDAVDIAKRMAGIKGEVNLVYPKKKRGSIFDLLFSNIGRGIFNILKENLHKDNLAVSYILPEINHQ